MKVISADGGVEQREDDITRNNSELCDSSLDIILCHELNYLFVIKYIEITWKFFSNQQTLVLTDFGLNGHYQV